jgi:hypothetical protein
MTAAAPSPPRWLLLAHQLPTQPSNARVKTWRRLQQIGAVPVRNSVYALPNTDACREDFAWIRSEIIALGGEATVFAADALADEGTAAIVDAIQRARRADYKALKRDVDRMGPPRRTQRASSSRHDQVSRGVRQLRDRFTAIRRIDFFNAPGGAALADTLDRVEAQLAERTVEPQEANVHVSPKAFRNRAWVTRPRPGVDRMASAWLIRRFIDPKARFVFAAAPGGADVPFDMYTGEFSHQGTLCTFEVLAKRFKIADPAVARLAQVVHDLDMKESVYGAPETPAVGRMVEGLRQVHAEDQPLLEQGIAMFEALARSFESSAPAPRKPRRAR